MGIQAIEHVSVKRLPGARYPIIGEHRQGQECQRHPFLRLIAIRGIRMQTPEDPVSLVKGYEKSSSMGGYPFQSIPLRPLVVWDA
jgi:hypothetical protein